METIPSINIEKTEKCHETILEIKDLRIGFLIERKIKHIVFGVDFYVQKGQALTILGESGCGKSVMGSAILKLLPYNAVVEGKVYFEGREILEMSERDFRYLRGKGIAAAFQGGEAGLDPLVKIGRQSAEGIMYHERLSYQDAISRVEEMFFAVGLANPKEIMELYPHQLSGGMNQRVLLGMTALLHPQFLLLDEPTKGLDIVSKQDTLNSLKRLRKETNSAVLLITHDIDLARTLSDRIMVMYAGQIIEILSPNEIDNPRHPYTSGLLASAPKGGFVPIPGAAPDSFAMPQGCHFFPRCNFASGQCQTEMPELMAHETGSLRCFEPVR
jgi:oligopeptide/dipeptide ABC transporter ATP-binding protein